MPSLLRNPALNSLRLGAPASRLNEKARPASSPLPWSWIAGGRHPAQAGQWHSHPGKRKAGRETTGLPVCVGGQSCKLEARELWGCHSLFRDEAAEKWGVKQMNRDKQQKEMERGSLRASIGPDVLWPLSVKFFLVSANSGWFLLLATPKPYLI